MPDVATGLTDPISGSLASAISSYQGSLKEHTADVSKRMGAATSEYDQGIAKDEEARAALDAKARAPGGALSPPEQKPAPTTKATEPLAIWGSSAMWIAALGGLLTRRPLTNALNAASSVMNAYRSMDFAKAQQEYDVWKTENDNAMKMAQFTLDSYKDALEDIKDSESVRMAKFQVIAKSIGDENAAYVAQHYGFPGAIQLVIAAQNHIDRAAKQAPVIKKQQDELQVYGAVHDARTTLKKAQQAAAANPGDKKAAAAVATAQTSLNSAIQAMRDFTALKSGSGGGSGVTSLTPDAVTEVAQQYIAGDKGVLNTISYRDTEGRAAVRNKIAELMKAQNLSAADVADKLETFDTTTKAFATRQQGNSVRAFSVLLSHFDVLKKVYAALQNGDVQALNAMKNRFATEFGEAMPTNVDGAKQIISAEIIKAVTGSAGALGDRETAEETISTHSSPEQVAGLLDTYQRLALGQLTGLKRQYEAGSGLKDFDKMLSPEAKSLLGVKGGTYPLVTTKKEYDALQSGDMYRENDGNVYSKP